MQAIRTFLLTMKCDGWILCDSIKSFLSASVRIQIVALEF
jgi:hypothetical protein